MSGALVRAREALTRWQYRLEAVPGPATVSRRIRKKITFNPGNQLTTGTGDGYAHATLPR
jgi:hypothetical protein